MWVGSFCPDFSHNFPFPKLLTPYNTTEPKICQDLFVKKFTHIAGVGNFCLYLWERHPCLDYRREACKDKSPAILCRDDYDGGGGAVSVFFCCLNQDSQD